MNTLSDGPPLPEAEPDSRSLRPSPTRQVPRATPPGQLQFEGRVGPRSPFGARPLAVQRRDALQNLRNELTMRRAPVRDGLAQVLVVVSPSPGEGRSTVAADLAAVVAQTGARTLLVDGDFRSPSLHTQFGVARENGLAEAIADEAAPLLHGLDGQRPFWLMAAGRPVEDPLERLSNPTLRQMVQHWRSALDTIVIDTPPGSKFLDALVLATLATQVLMVSRQDHTSADLVERLLKRLARLDIPVAGAVMNRF